MLKNLHWLDSGQIVTLAKEITKADQIAFLNVKFQTRANLISLKHIYILVYQYLTTIIFPEPTKPNHSKW